MNQRSLASTGAFAIATAIVALAAVPALAQAPAGAKAASAARTLPRTPDGQPDLQGVWDYATVTPLERPAELAGKAVLTAEEAAEFEKRTVAARNQDNREGAGTEADVRRAYNDFWWDRGTRVVPGGQTSLVVDPPDGKVPALTPGAQKREEARDAEERRHGPADSWEDRGLWERCLTRTLPRLPGAYNNNFQLFQGAGYVVILNEMIHEARVIPLDGRPHGKIRQWLGDSRGRWEGDTLVVETTNFREKANFRGASENLRLTERFTRVDADTLRYEVKVDDPTTFTKPWTIAVPMRKNPEQIFEYACHEGNYGMMNLLAGHRAEEKAAAEAAKKGSR